MLNQEIIIKRLAFIKYLYKIGVAQSQQVETIASISILAFHDSIEMFLKLIAEHSNTKSEDLKFMQYWDKFPKLTLRESMKNINARRVNIKHRGLLPSKADIETSRVNTTDFFEQNTPIFFNIKFGQISLFSLIDRKTIREELEKAQNALEAKEFDFDIRTIEDEKVLERCADWLPQDKSDKISVLSSLQDVMET